MRMVRKETGLPLSRACELAGVSRSSAYYRPVPVDAETLMLQSLVDRLYMNFPYYGTRRVSWHLKRLGHDVGRGRARSLMAAGIGAVHGSGVDHSADPGDHKLPTRAFIQQEAHLALPSNCPNDPDHLSVPSRTC